MDEKEEQGKSVGMDVSRKGYGTVTEKCNNRKAGRYSEQIFSPTDSLHSHCY